MSNEELYYLLALQKVNGVGDISAKKLLRHLGSATEIFKASKNKSINVPDIGTYMIEQIRTFKDFKKVEIELKYIEKNKLKVTTIFDDDYPKKLFHAPDGPILFFSKGDFSLENRKTISIVGTRNITSYGKRIVAEIIEELAQ